MAPNVFTRGPEVARLTARKLRDVMARWRRQPRQGSARLYGGLLGLALLLDAASLGQGAYLFRHASAVDVLAVLTGPAEAARLQASSPVSLAAASSSSLRNLLLTVPPLLVLAGEATLLLAWFAGNLNLALMLLAPHRNRLFRVVAAVCGRVLRPGVLLLGAGLLPGCWRGWAGAEHWELLVLACYLTLLLANGRGAVGPFGLSAWSAACFGLVLLAPDAGPGPGGARGVWLCWAVLANGALVAHAALRYWCGRQNPASA
jgi:plasmid stabilization system protein ParE